MITKAIPELSKEDAKNFPRSRRIAIWFKIVQNAAGDLDEGKLIKRVRSWIRLPSQQMTQNPEYLESVNNELRKFLTAMGITVEDFSAGIQAAQNNVGGAAELWEAEGTELAFLHEEVCPAYLTYEDSEEYGAQNRISYFIVA